MEQQWITCPHCGKKQFPYDDNTIIKYLKWKCKRCKEVFEIDNIDYGENGGNDGDIQEEASRG